jgi:hypothetical protein
MLRDVVGVTDVERPGVPDWLRVFAGVPLRVFGGVLVRVRVTSPDADRVSVTRDGLLVIVVREMSERLNDADTSGVAETEAVNRGDTDSDCEASVNVNVADRRGVPVRVRGTVFVYVSVSAPDGEGVDDRNAVPVGVGRDSLGDCSADTVSDAESDAFALAEAETDKPAVDDADSDASGVVVLLRVRLPTASARIAA